MPTNEENNQAATNADAANVAAASPVSPTPPKKKTLLGSAIADVEKDVVSVGAFIGKEAGVIGKLFAKEEPAIQTDLKTASQWVQIIKTEATENPMVVAYLLRKINPAYTDEQLNALLTKAASAIGVTQTIVQPTLSDTIAALQAHASQLPDEVTHNVFWSGFFNALGILVAPGTAFSKIVTFGIYIYNNFIKPKVA